MQPKRKVKRFIKGESGVAGVEFVIVFVFFLVIVLFLFETCRFISLVSTLDLSLAESGRLASRNKLNNQTYLEVFNKNLRDRNKTLMWLFFKDATIDQVKMDIRYCNDVSEIVNDTCDKNNRKQMAIYNVSYSYSTMFLPIPDKVFNDLNISTYAVYVQEHAVSKG